MKKKGSPEKELSKIMYKLTLQHTRKLDENERIRREETKKKEEETRAKLIEWAKTELVKKEGVSIVPQSFDTGEAGVIKGTVTPFDTGEAGAEKRKYPDTGGG